MDHKKLEQRLQKLEGQLKFYRSCFGLFIVLFGAFFLMSSQSGDEVLEVIKAKRILLMGDHGNALLKIGQANTESGKRSAGFQLVNEAGKTILFMGASSESGAGYLEINNSEGLRQATLTDNPSSGGGNMWLYDAAGKKKMYLGNDSKSNIGKVCTYNQNNQINTCLGVRK